MDGSIRYLVHNPSSLKLLSVCRIRQLISCLGENVERNLIEKLTAGDIVDLKNPNVPISLEDMCLIERKYVLESCLRHGSWGLLEMYILLTDDIVDFDVHHTVGMWEDLDDLETVREQLAPAIDIKLHYEQYADLFLSLLMVKCPKLEQLRLRMLAPSPTALQRFCEAMPNITKLDLSLEHHPKGYNDKHSYDGVLKAIASNMPHLMHLNIFCCTVKPEAIEYLLPTEDNALGGCSELVELDLFGIITVDVKLLKMIILALPKLRFLGHELLVNALVDLTEEEMGVDTAWSLSFLDSWIDSNQVENFPSLRFDILAESPVFQRLINNITTVYITIYEQEQNKSTLVANILMSLTKLRYLQLCGISETNKLFLPVFESIGDRLQYLVLHDTSESINVHDIMRTCPKLNYLKLYRCVGDVAPPENDINLLYDQVEEPMKPPLLHCLTRICLGNMDKQVCSADMLMTLLQSPNLDTIVLANLEAMSDDVMSNVLSSPGGAALSKVTQFSVIACRYITEAPLVYWLAKENCSLEELSFCKCEKIDCEILRAAAKNFPRVLIIVDY